VYISSDTSSHFGHKTLYCRSKNLITKAEVGDKIYGDYGKVTLKVLSFHNPI
jgi:pyruvate kinase